MNEGDRWIVIPHWDDFQHYKKRDAPWIKTYTRLMFKPEYLGLTFHQRGVLHSLWITYATTNRQIRDNTLTLTRQLGHRVLRRDLEALNHAGFIEFSASKPLASRDRDRDIPLYPHNNNCPECNVGLRGVTLEEHLENVHGKVA